MYLGGRDRTKAERCRRSMEGKRKAGEEVGNSIGGSNLENNLIPNYSGDDEKYDIMT